ncbi:YqaE/Pmp3 family membrane protein [Salicibibacter cibarius]|uniref:YqaE/Pmp3 family membrane protein n=1 Tax=Salicibibacter cibarius TaxID=2743000 RepID=A0A7T6Z5A0_9BACI|nr:YqaE/Pmp3 family membrane protein [Salicibibacter cibarius]QQK77248.1 YqaE/Pmp3 family membrane protein [Salicibibacter cibarius]
MYLLAILLPPLAVFLVGKPFQGIISIVLTILGWVPGAIHAILVVHEKKQDKRMEKQARIIAESQNKQ